MQKIFISGTIGRDAVVRSTGSGDDVAGFSVVVDNGKDKNGQKRDGTWYDCSLWGKRGTALAPYLTKGTKVSIMGRPGAREHAGKVYLQCSVDEITLQGGGQQGEQRGDYDSSRGDEGSGARPSSRDMDDEIPFAPEWRI